MSASSVQHIGVYTSGGDAPGMNAAIRAVVRTGINLGLKVTGILTGYNGMIAGDFLELDRRSMSNILQRGGTLLKTGRCPEFRKEAGRKTAAEQIRKVGIDSLICIGGDGSFRGAHQLWEEHKIPIIGIPATIDNDIYGTDYTLGFDTAVNTALDAIDRVRDSATSHDRLFIVEVMGRNSGFIATEVALAGGAEEVFFTDLPVTVNQAIVRIKKSVADGKKSSIIITAEGEKPGRAYDLAESIRKKAGFEARVCVLGHVQRGGSPTARDRVIASRLGATAVQSLISGHSDIMIGLVADELVQRPLGIKDGQKKVVNPDTINLIRVLSQ